MKEYKVVTFTMGLTNNNQRLEDVLNEEARQGWRMVQFIDSYSRIIFERDKNR